MKVRTVGVRDPASMGLSVDATDSVCAMTLRCEVDMTPLGLHRRTAGSGAVHISLRAGLIGGKGVHQ